MRKTSQDGGEFSATSAVENEVKKPKGLLSELKTKKIVKRTAPNLSEDSDDAVVEPLLQKSTNSTIQSAKYFAKAKADTVKEITKLFNDKKTQYASTSGFGTTETLLSEKDQAESKTNASYVPQHNHMNTNVFHSLDNAKANGTAKTQVLVEIEGSKQSGSNPSPLIFTTAKIHTEGKSNHMDPIQMSPAPILSTVEMTVSKDGNIVSNEKKISNGTSAIMNISFSQPLKPNMAENTNFSTTVKAQNSTSKSDNSNKTLFTNNSKEGKTTTAKPDKTQLNYPSKTDPLSSQSELTTSENNPIASKSKDPNKMSEPSSSQIQRSNIVVQTIKSPSEEKKAVESSAQLPFITQTHKKEKPNTIDSDSKSRTKDRDSKEKEAKSLTAVNIKPIVIENQSISSVKALERQRNITAEEELLKMETKIKSSQIPECLKDTSAKPSSSTNTLMQAKVSESKLNTDTNLSLKSSVDNKSKLNSTNNTADAPKESSVSPHTVKPGRDPLLPATNVSNPEEDKNSKITTSDIITSDANKFQAKTTKTVSSTTDTVSSSTDKTKTITTKAPTIIAEKAISNADKTQSITATSTTDTGSTNTDKIESTITNRQTSLSEKASSKANKTQAVIATPMVDKASSKGIKAPTSISDKVSSNAYKAQEIPSKVATSIANIASSNANETRTVTAISIADKANSKVNMPKTQPTVAPASISDKTSSNANKAHAISSKVATSIADKASSNANKTQAVTATSIAEKANSKVDKTQTLPTMAPTSISDKTNSNPIKTQAATSIADKAGSHTNKSQPVTTKAATSTGDPISSKANKTISTKSAIPTTTKPTTATSTKTPTKPISVATVSKTSINKPSSTTPSSNIAQVTSAASVTTKPLVGKTAQVSTSTTKPAQITSSPTVPAEHSKKIKTNETSNKIGSKSSDLTKDVKVTKA